MQHFMDFAESFNLFTGKIRDVCDDEVASLRAIGSVEDFLDFLVKDYGVLLHGSVKDISGEMLKPNKYSILFATDLGCVTLLNAIISSRNLIFPGIEYKIIIDDDNPLAVRIHGMNSLTIKDKGYVYVITDTDKKITKIRHSG